MVLKTLDVLGPLHGYGLARRIEQISGDGLTLNPGTLYPVLLRLEQEGVAVVNETLARHFWPAGGAVGGVMILESDRDSGPYSSPAAGPTTRRGAHVSSG